MSERAPVIAVDGPSGSGKGTVSLRLATERGWHFLDSGALYRLVGVAAGRHGITLDDAERLRELAADLEVEFLPGDGEPRVVLEGDDVSDVIRTEKAGNAASKVAAIPEVREALLARQRAFRQPPGLVADGRDMGTVVFPDAEVKIFLTASAEVRAERRYKQLRDKGFDVSLSDLVAEITERDERDSSRKTAPLKPAVDSVVVDTSGLSIEGVMAQVRQVCDSRLSHNE